MIVLIHSSKTMRQPDEDAPQINQPLFIDKATELNTYLKSLSTRILGKHMHISDKVAQKTFEDIKIWDPHSKRQLPAIDSFKGDIYSGLKVHEFNDGDRAYAHKKLRILSGLYGVLRAEDSIQPYRLEMAYRLPRKNYSNLYSFWGDSIARSLPTDELIVNASAEEYTRAVLPFINEENIITPKFLTISPKTGEPTFVVVHAKIARGAFAHWIIKNRIDNESDLQTFADHGYQYDPELSSERAPAYVCKTFGGLGLSVRLR